MATLFLFSFDRIEHLFRTILKFFFSFSSLSLLSLVPDILFLRVRNAAYNTFFFYVIIFFHSYVTAYSLQHQSLQDLSLSDGADIYICPLSMEEEWS